VAGLVIHELQHLPETGEVVETLGWRFEVVDMDGRRVDKVLARRAGSETATLEGVAMADGPLS
jgi:putative hemolysin